MGIGIRLFRNTASKPSLREIQAKAQPQLAGVGIHRADPSSLCSFDKTKVVVHVVRTTKNNPLLLRALLRKV